MRQFTLLIILFMFTLASAKCQDTLAVTFYVKDTTYQIQEVYALVDAYGDTITSNMSNDWIQTMPGYIITGEYRNIFYSLIDPKFKILNFQERKKP